MNRLTVPLLVVCVALAGWAVWERLENSRLTNRLAALEDQAGKRQAPGDKESVLAAALSKTGAKPGSSAAAKESSDAGAASAQPGEEGKSMADGFAKMMRDPKMREAMKAQASMGIDMMYRDLFDLLDLPEPKRSEFEKLIREKTTAGMEIGFAMMGEKKTPEEMKAVSEDLQAKTKAMDDKILELLGQEDFDKMRRYEDSTNERMQLRTFSSMLASKGLDMDEATETKLMDAMYDERKNFPFASDFGNQQNTDMTRFTPENINRFGEEYSQFSQGVVKRAEGILTAPQLEVFRQSQEQMATMTKMHIEMAGKMFGETDP
jgi:hypothetical protein